VADIGILQPNVSYEKGVSRMAAAAPPAISLEKAPIADVFTDLHADMHQGLTSAEARARAGQYGPNAIEEKKKSQLSMFLAYFWGPMPWICLLYTSRCV